jgi:hypothetical protein
LPRQRSTYPLTPTLQPQTIGVGGTFNTSRPVRIERASIVSAGSETPLCILSDAEWQNLQGKTSAGRPVSLWVDATYPLMGLWLNPIPNVADTLVLYTWQQLNASPQPTRFDLPPGYARAIRDNLAKEFAPEFGVSALRRGREHRGRVEGQPEAPERPAELPALDPAMLLAAASTSSPGTGE